MTTHFGDFLKALRGELGFKSALAFYDSLAAKAQLEFNYAYYKRFENNDVLPSTKVINSLVELVPEKYRDQLILIYCAACFPKNRKIFKIAESSAAAKPKNKIQYQSKGTRSPQRILNEKEIAILSSDRNVYFLYLLLTLRKVPIAIVDLKELFGGSEFDVARKGILASRLGYEEGDLLYSSAPEFAFPEASTPSLQKMYNTLNAFDREKSEFFGLKKRLSTEMFRCVPERHADIIIDHLQLLLRTLRVSEDSVPEENGEVVSLSFQFLQGKIPGKAA